MASKKKSFQFLLAGVSEIPEIVSKDIEILFTDYAKIKELCEKFENNLGDLMNCAELQNEAIHSSRSTLSRTSAHQTTCKRATSPR